MKKIIILALALVLALSLAACSGGTGNGSNNSTNNDVNSDTIDISDIFGTYEGIIGLEMPMTLTIKGSSGMLGHEYKIDIEWTYGEAVYSDDRATYNPNTGEGSGKREYQMSVDYVTYLIKDGTATGSFYNTKFTLTKID